VRPPLSSSRLPSHDYCYSSVLALDKADLITTCSACLIYCNSI
jgi:hypothetical protein